MTTEVRDIGDGETLTASFTNNDSPAIAANPTTVTLKIRQPNGTVITRSTADSPATITNEVTGTFESDFTYAQEGRHFIEWVGTGTVVAAVSGERYVLRSNVA
jgi:hypothetical protein